MLYAETIVKKLNIVYIVNKTGINHIEILSINKI